MRHTSQPQHRAATTPTTVDLLVLIAIAASIAALAHRIVVVM